MVEASKSIRRHEDTYCLYYQKKYDEVPKFKHQRTLALTAKKLVHLVITTRDLVSTLHTGKERITQKLTDCCF